MQGSREFRETLAQLDIQRGDVVYLHTSFKRLKGLGLTAEQIIETLLERLGSTGTLALPAFGWNTDKTQRPWKSYENYFNGQSVFDVRNTPANIGHVPEVFRRLSGVKRSIHYWFSVCASGLLATELVTGQEQVLHPWGPGSSFDLLRLAEAKILGLGVSLNTASLCHTADYALGNRHTQQVFTSEPKVGVVVDQEGNRIETRSYWLLPQTVRSIRPSAVIEASEKVRQAVHRADAGETIRFSYPYKVYHEEAVRLGLAACATGHGMPWLENLPAKSSK